MTVNNAISLSSLNGRYRVRIDSGPHDVLERTCVPAFEMRQLCPFLSPQCPDVQRALTAIQLLTNDLSFSDLGVVAVVVMIVVMVTDGDGGGG